MNALPPPLDPAALGLVRPDAAGLAALAAVVGPDGVRTDEEARAAFGRDETEDLCFLPDAVVVPASTEEVSRLLALANARRWPVVPRGAGTGLSGGALPVAGGIVLSLARLDRIRELDLENLTVTAEAGVVLADLQARVAEHGLRYPPDPASRDSCQLGGTLAENSAGPRTCRYGATRHWVLGLEAVLADGTRLVTGGKNRKDVAGYDLTGLLVGSEGTLAVLTAATLRLVAAPRTSLTLILPFPTLDGAAAAVAALFRAGHQPTACELVEERALAAVGRLLPLPGTLVGRAAMLLVELEGDDDETLLGEAAALEELVRDLGGDEALAASDPAEQRRLWAIRSKVGEAVKGGSIYKEADTVVPRSALAELVRAARAAAERHGLQAVCYGHAGDGNLHVNLLKGDLPAALWRERRDAAEAELFRAVIGLGGSITGEHGVGWTQRRYLPLRHPAAAIGLQRELKRAFDPRGILNPGKIFPGDAETAPGEPC